MKIYLIKEKRYAEGFVSTDGKAYYIDHMTGELEEYTDYKIIYDNTTEAS
jgi:hypothetical protein